MAAEGEEPAEVDVRFVQPQTEAAEVFQPVERVLYPLP
jgi:hypothetical protein